jgi:hypothetical protein
MAIESALIATPAAPSRAASASRSPRVTLRRAVAQELAPAAREHAVHHPPELVDGIERGIGYERVQRHRPGRCGIAHAHPLEVEQPLDERRQNRLEGRGRHGRPPHERAPPHRRLDPPLTRERLVGERHRVAVHRQAARELPDRGQPIARPEPPGLDLGAKVGSDLLVDRQRPTVRAAFQEDLHRAQYRSRTSYRSIGSIDRIDGD